MKTKRETYTKVFHLRNRDGSTSEIDIEVYRESGYEFLTQAASAAITRAKIEEIRCLNVELDAALQSLVGYLAAAKMNSARAKQLLERANIAIAKNQKAIGKTPPPQPIAIKLPLNP